MTFMLIMILWKHLTTSGYRNLSYINISKYLISINTPEHCPVEKEVVCSTSVSFNPAFFPPHAVTCRHRFFDISKMSGVVSHAVMVPAQIRSCRNSLSV